MQATVFEVPKTATRYESTKVFGFLVYIKFASLPQNTPVISMGKCRTGEIAISPEAYEIVDIAGTYAANLKIVADPTL